MIASVIILGVLCLILSAQDAWQLTKKPASQNAESALLLKADMTELTKSVSDLKDGLPKQLSYQLGQSN